MKPGINIFHLKNDKILYVPIIEAPLRMPLWTEVILKSHCADGTTKDTDVTLMATAEKSEPQINSM